MRRRGQQKKVVAVDGRERYKQPDVSQASVLITVVHDPTSQYATIAVPRARIALN